MLDKEMDDNERFVEKLKEYNKDVCPNCGRKIDLYDLAWNAASTEYGTPYASVEIQCQECDTEIASGHSWYPADCLDDVIEKVLDDILE